MTAVYRWIVTNPTDIMTAARQCFALTNASAAAAPRKPFASNPETALALAPSASAAPMADAKPIAAHIALRDAAIKRPRFGCVPDGGMGHYIPLVKAGHIYQRFSFGIARIIDDRCENPGLSINLRFVRSFRFH